MKALVPANHRPFEHALAEVLAPIRAIDPRAIEQVWNAWSSPAPLLPFLGYALSVDFWDDAWDEIRKRQAIAESPDYHRRKGTRAAVEDALALTRRDVLIAEWWQVTHQSRRGTFHVTILLGDDEEALPAPDMALARRLVRLAKPKSRAFTLAASHFVTGEVSVRVGIAAGGGPILMVEPDPIELNFTPRVWLAPSAGVPLEVQ